MNEETFDTLWAYCASNNRVCLMPMQWNDLFGMLENNNQLNVPLILNGWEMSSPLEKSLRFEEHIRAAFDNNQIKDIGKYLRSLPEEGWAHYGEV